jgi:streptogramin lyase
MLALFTRHRSRFARSSRSRRNRVATVGVTPERLEQRIALAADGARTLLGQASTLVMDQSMGPSPVVMTMQQVAGTDVKSFVISHVPEGSSVEKWDAATESWIDVSTMPSSSQPQQLMLFLANRTIHQGDTIQWRPSAGVDGAVRQAFEMINWDDGSELQGASDQAPTAVRNLAVSPTGVGELTLSWDAPALGDATSYTVTMTTTAGNGSTTSQTHVTSQRSLTQAGLSSANAYGFSVVATNASGTSVAATAAFGQTPLTTLDRSYALTTGQDGSIWVASVQFQTVNQITFADGVWTPQPAIGVNGEPIALTTGLDGSIWVSNLNTSNVQQITNVNGVWTVQDTISVIDESGYEADNVAITTSFDGSIWVANRNYNSVQQIADTWGPWAAETPISLSDKAGSNNEGPLPNAITAGLDGSIWLANQGTDSNEGGNSVQQVTNAGGVWTAQPAIAVGTTPRAITTGLDGSIWVANTGSNTVQQIAQVNGAWVAQPAIAVGTGPRGLVAGLDGSIWVANTGSNTVQQISNVGGVWNAQPAIAAGANPFGLTVGPNGSLWVTNTDSNTLQQIVIPAGSPLNVLADTSSSPGNITLNWSAPVTNGGAPITTYTATVWQGEQTHTIQTSDTSAIFEGLSAGSGPTYFTVTAINFAGVSPAAEFLLDQAGNPVTVADARIGFTTDGDASFGPSFDDSGNSYSWDALGDTTSGGTRVGNSLLWNGVSFELGSPNQPDVLAANGQTVPFSGTGNVLTLAAAAINGGQENQQILLTFTDSSTATWTQSFSDWCDPQNYAGESTISAQSYLNTLSGEQVSTANNVYGYSYALPEGKTLASLTLPHNVNLRVLDAAVASSTSVDLSGDFNFWGIANGQTQAANNDGFDRNGHYYYSGDLPSSLTWASATFNFGPTSTSKHGTNNFVQAQGQSIGLPAGDFGMLYLAAAAANGSQENQQFTLHFSDGSQETWTQSLSDWCSYESFEGQTVLSTQSNWVDQVGNVRSQTNRVYGYAYQLPAGKTLTSITLPNNHNVGILAIALA